MRLYIFGPIAYCCFKKFGQRHSELSNIRNPVAVRAWLKTVCAHKCLDWKRTREFVDGIEQISASGVKWVDF